MEKENLFLSEVFQNYDFYESVFHSSDDEFDSFVSVYGVHFLSDVKPFLTSNEVNLTSGDEIQ